MSESARGILTAGGASVHRIVRRQTRPTDDDAAPRTDPTPIVERYHDLATAMHRTAIAPRGDRFIWGCTCGKYGLTPQGSSAKANMVAAQHVLDAAEEMQRNLEGTPIGAEDDDGFRH